MQPAESIDVGGVRMPLLVYGTAWKEERTSALVRTALEEGFRGIDTANQRRHYFEAAVGDALTSAIKDGLVSREDVFLQTKFTFRAGQDQRLPYDPKAPVATQVRQSFEKSLEHLGVEHLDSLVMHGPSTYPGLADADWEAWSAMEDLQRGGRVGIIGISNVASEQLRDLHAKARVKPAVVQNRTFTRPRADADVRAFCRENGLAYQGFSLLTAIPQVLSHPTFIDLAQRSERSPAQLVFSYWIARGLVALTGTSDRTHMREDLACRSRPLDPSVEKEVAAILGP